ncbi:MAG: oxygen-independent coproporphyrinogen III oxidase [Bacteroidetes bacterium]|nr:oxygen-independent coproporphyrinogen III oxidase [Bacteroidota bacterium]
MNNLTDTDTTLELLKKFDVAVPRYTSYPTVPFWDFNTINDELWLNSLVNAFKEESNRLCIYIHLPYCESLCTFCACNKRITKKHDVEGPYIEALLKEWTMYLKEFDSIPIVQEIHLGGGTPTFFTPRNLERLINGIMKNAKRAEDHEFSIEVHPNYTKEEHLKVLSNLGFNRISMGVQDFEPKVQFAINRIQSFETTKKVSDWANKYGFRSTNIDLVYGLPHQRNESIEYSINKINELNPGRIAFYSYAHVPWKSKGQRGYTEADLPASDEKLRMYQLGRSMLEKIGYLPIGMDHFSLPDDPLFNVKLQGRLHRNFMGYTTTNSRVILGLGASSISDSGKAYVQNEKTVEDYIEKIDQGKFPLINGHLLSNEDLQIKSMILDLMCRDKLKLDTAKLPIGLREKVIDQFRSFEDDGLLKLNQQDVTVEEMGKLFIRNVCSTLDAYLWRNPTGENRFSKAV